MAPLPHQHLTPFFIHSPFSVPILTPFSSQTFSYVQPSPFGPACYRHCGLLPASLAPAFRLREPLPANLPKCCFNHHTVPSAEPSVAPALLLLESYICSSVWLVTPPANTVNDQADPHLSLRPQCCLHKGPRRGVTSTSVPLPVSLGHQLVWQENSLLC